MHVYNIGVSGRNLTKRYQGTWLLAGTIKWTLILQGVPLQNLEGLLTIFEFDHKYLRNGSTYRKSEKYLINNI